MAVTPRKFDAQSNAWTDGETTFWDTTAWRKVAEHVAESLAKGVRVIATGTVRTHRWEDQTTGEPRSRVVLDLEDIGPSLTFANAKVEKAERTNGRPRAGSGDDAWAAGPAPSAGSGEEPPF
ncbi:single-stranded DNA-binding protein [Yinghuangia aomiensis]